MHPVEAGNLREGQHVIIQTGDESILVGAVKQVDRELRNVSLEVWARTSASAYGEGTQHLSLDDVSIAWTGSPDECKDVRSELERSPDDTAALRKWVEERATRDEEGGDTMGSRKSE
jgi:hypothetical protein